MRFCALLTFSVFLAACSLYQSDGRKYLEKNSYQYAGVAAHSTCAKDSVSQPSDQWVLLSQNSEARVLAHENDSFEFRVIPLNQSGPQEFSCLFKADTAQELFEMTSDAIAYTVVKFTEAE